MCKTILLKKNKKDKNKIRFKHDMILQCLWYGYYYTIWSNVSFNVIRLNNFTNEVSAFVRYMEHV